MKDFINDSGAIQKLKEKIHLCVNSFITENVFFRRSDDYIHIFIEINPFFDSDPDSDSEEKYEINISGVSYDLETFSDDNSVESCIRIEYLNNVYNNRLTMSQEKRSYKEFCEEALYFSIINFFKDHYE